MFSLYFFIVKSEKQKNWNVTKLQEKELPEYTFYEKSRKQKIDNTDGICSNFFLIHQRLLRQIGSYLIFSLMVNFKN